MRCSSRQTSLLVGLMSRTSAMSSTLTCPIRPRLTLTASAAPVAQSRTGRLAPLLRERISLGSRRSRRSSPWTSRVSRSGTLSAMRARTSLAGGGRLGRDAPGRSAAVSPLGRGGVVPPIITVRRQRLAAEGAPAKAALRASLLGRPQAPPLERASTRAGLMESAALRDSSVRGVKALRGRALPQVSPQAGEANLANRGLVVRARVAVRAPLCREAHAGRYERLSMRALRILGCCRCSLLSS